MPSTFSAEDELFGIGWVPGDLGTGLFEDTHDLPADAVHVLQSVRGYDATIVSGTIARRNAEDTVACSAVLLRGAPDAS